MGVILLRYKDKAAYIKLSGSDDISEYTEKARAALEAAEKVREDGLCGGSKKQY